MVRPVPLPRAFAERWRALALFARVTLTAVLLTDMVITPTSAGVRYVCQAASSDVGSNQVAPTGPIVTAGPKKFGVGVAGPEFTESHLPGTLGTDYIYPTNGQRFAYFHEHGLTLARLPVLWERVQPRAFGPLSEKDVAGIRAVLEAAAANGVQVIIDLHNYGRYYNQPLSRSDAAEFADFWQRLTKATSGHSGLYGYELMNEPHDLPGGSASWAYLSQVATNAIREQDRTAWILVPGYGWQSAQQWPANNPTLDVHDPAGRLLYAAHVYFDRDSTGTYAHSYDADQTNVCIGVERLQPFIQWLNRHNAQGILTEYGVPNTDPRWLAVLDRFLAALDASPQIVGGTYWPAGPWWGNNPLSVEPSQGRDRPQAAVLFRYPSRP